MKIISVFLIAAATALGAGPAAAAGPRVDALRFGGDDATTRIVLEASGEPEYSVFTLAEQGDRVVVDLASVTWRLAGEAIGGGQRAGAGDGLVSQYRYADFSEARSRLVFDLAAPANVKRHFVIPPDSHCACHRLVIDLVRTDRATFDHASGFPGDVVADIAASGPPVRRQELLTVVIDAGHGGKDTGATGVTGAREKHVNLAVARAVRDRLVATGRYRVVMTRDSDVYLDLPERVKTARDAQADLFISFHADASAGGSSARGASVYTLAERANGRAKSEILKDDNWLLDVDLAGRREEVSSILVDLAQRETKNQSAAFADLLIPNMRTVGPVVRNTHRSAGFFVLLAPDVPAVLLEMGFLTNAVDESALTSAPHQVEIADAVVASIEGYFDRRERLYAAR